MNNISLKKNIYECFYIVVFISLFLVSCVTGPSLREQTENSMAVNIDAGAIDIDVNHLFTATFSTSIKVSSMSSSTFFVVPRTGEDGSLSNNTAVKMSGFNTSICNSTHAVVATITPVSSSDCDISFVLSPLSSLLEGTNYAICATPGIVLCNSNVDGFFSGAMQEFTTAFSAAECVVEESCSSECGNTGYSNNSGTSCYSDATCSTECSGDTTKPTVTITSSEATLTAQDPFTITITFNEEIIGFELSDISVTNASVSNLTATTANKIYTASIAPSGDTKDITISIPAGSATDANENENKISNTFSIRYDSSALTVSITSDVDDLTNESPFSVTITFSEAVSSFVVGDISVTNGSAGNFSSASNPVFTADITPTTDGEVTVEVGASIATDVFSETKSNTAAVPFSATYDSTAPEVDSTDPADEDTNVSIDTTVAVIFSEAMDTETITTNTADTDCDGSFQVSDDDFTTCVQMSGAPTASNGNKTFTITPASSLDESTTYKIRITTNASDAFGNFLAEIYTTSTGFLTETTTKIIYVTNYHNANLGGVSGADSLCNSDARKPNASTYKAIITDNSTRIACTTAFCSGGTSENLDWVLSPDTAYVNSNGDPIGTTNAGGVFTFPFTNGFGYGLEIWTGMATSRNWLSAGIAPCSGFTSTSGTGVIGHGDITSSTMLYIYAQWCNGNGGTTAIACAEQ